MLGKEVVELYEASVAGNHEKASMLQKRLIAPNQAVTKLFGVPGLKVAMDQFGYNSGHLREPLLPLSESDEKKLKSIFAANRFL